MALVNITKINESFFKINTDFDIAHNISEHFAFFPENYRWNSKYKSGQWDGKIRLFSVKNGLLPQGLLGRTVKFLKDIGYDYTLNGYDKGSKIFSDELICKFAEKIKCDLVPRDYQLAAIREIFKNPKSGILSATGSGKSFIFYLAINMIKHLNPNFKFLLVVPTTGLVEQMEFDFCDYSRNYKDYKTLIHKVYSGINKNTDKPITVSTWQSLQELPTEWFDQFDAIFVDEFHTAQGKELSRIIEACSNAVYKIGLSGSLYESKTHELQLEAMFGFIRRVSTTKELIDRNVLSKFKILNYILEYTPEEKLAVKGFDYTNECKFIRSNTKRLALIVKMVSKMDKNSLCLFKSVDYGKSLHKYLTKYNPDKQVFYVDKDVKIADRERIRQAAEKDSNVIIVASYGTFSTGINIKNLHYLIMVDSMKSSVKIIQSIGRSLRKHDEKNCAVLIDITDDFSYKGKNGKIHKNYTLEHFFARVKIYDKEQHPYEHKKVIL